MIDSRFDPRKWPGYLMAPLDGALLTIVVLILGFATVVMVSASPERLDTLALNVGVAFVVMWIAAVAKAVADPAVNKRMNELYAIPKTGTPQAARALMQRDLGYWRKVLSDNKITL